MAQSRCGQVDWYSPDTRAILPLDQFHVSRSLGRRVRQGFYHLTSNRAFDRVIRTCAEPRDSQPGTWISDEIIEVYNVLHHAGLAHSIEAWRDEHERELVGGLYGMCLGAAFFGESMFSRATDASKLCLAHLVDRLRQGGCTLLDVQFTTPHLESMGAVEVPRQRYLQLLHEAISRPTCWRGNV